MRTVALAEGGVPGEKGAPASPQGSTDLTLWLPVVAITSKPPGHPDSVGGSRAEPRPAFSCSERLSVP